MDERLVAYYNSELRHVREMAAEFAREFPKIAGRLALDRDAKEICPDPYVERLLEGFAFLTARMVSDKPTLEDRLRDYFAGMDRSIAQFASAPMKAVAFACTGASYLQGVEPEARAVDALQAAFTQVGKQLSGMGRMHRITFCGSDDLGFTPATASQAPKAAGCPVMNGSMGL